MNAPFLAPRLHLAPPEPAPEVIADLFLDLDEVERTAQQLRHQLSGFRQKFMQRERCYGPDMGTYRREVERRAGR